MCIKTLICEYHIPILEHHHNRWSAVWEKGWPSYQDRLEVEQVRVSAVTELFIVVGLRPLEGRQIGPGGWSTDSQQTEAFGH